eukprot:EG_transcript_72090
MQKNANYASCIFPPIAMSCFEIKTVCSPPFSSFVKATRAPQAEEVLFRPGRVHLPTPAVSHSGHLGSGKGLVARGTLNPGGGELASCRDQAFLKPPPPP